MTSILLMLTASLEAHVLETIRSRRSVCSSQNVFQLRNRRSKLSAMVGALSPGFAKGVTAAMGAQNIIRAARLDLAQWPPSTGAAFRGLRSCQAK